MHKFSLQSTRLTTLQMTAIGAGAIAVFTGLAFANSGEITPESIEIDANANLVDDGDGGQNGGTVDWVLDSIDNTGVDCLGSDGVANCNQANITAHPDGVGHWNGVRVVDSAGGNENDVFQGGSKFDDPGTWAVGPGTTGGSKFDASQAYLANNDDHLFFGLERVGFNGTTAWDIEFNVLPPDPANPYVPVRTTGDVLFVFEMNGSGGSGYVDIFLYEWNGTGFDPLAIPPDTVASINTSDVDAGPWGSRDSKGEWQLGQLHRLTFAEIALRIGAGGIDLPGNPADCSQRAYVGIRTRASNEFQSAMKDAMPIFEYQLSGIEVAAAKTAESAEHLNVTVTGIVSGGNPDRQWQVFNTENSIWEDIPGATDETLVVPSLGIDWASPYVTTTMVDSPFEVLGDPYIGQVYSTRVRLAASQNVGGVTCTVGSNAVTVKKLVAVDP